MKKSADEKVQTFIDGVSVLDGTQYQILQELRAIVFDCHPEVKEEMMYGGIMFSLEKHFSGVFAYKKHVSIEFGQGSSFDDPKNQLEGNGKYRRHLKFSTIEDIAMKDPAFYLKQVK